MLTYITLAWLLRCLAHMVGSAVPAFDHVQHAFVVASASQPAFVVWEGGAQGVEGVAVLGVDGSV